MIPVLDFLFRRSTIAAFLQLVLLSAVYCQNGQNPDCSVLRKFKLQYLDIGDSSAYVHLTNDSSFESFNSGKYSLTSRLVWKNDCEYDMILSTVNIPNFIYHPGDVMTVRIEKMEGNLVYYVSTINGDSWEGKLRIIR